MEVNRTMPEVVLMKQTESVTVITLNRPEKRNAVNYPMIAGDSHW